MIKLGYSVPEMAAVLLEFQHGHCAELAGAPGRNRGDEYALRTAASALSWQLREAPEAAAVPDPHTLGEMRSGASAWFHQRIKQPGRYLLDAPTRTGKTELCAQAL